MALLPAFALALTVALWAAVVLQSRSEQQDSHSEAVAASQALARVLAGHVSHFLRQGSHATQLFALKHEETDGNYRLATFAQRSGLLDSVLPARLELPMALLDRDGNIVDSINGFVRASLAGAAHFDALAGSRGDVAMVTTHVLDAASGKWQIRIARRLGNRAGQFDGAILIMVDPNLFVDDYDRLALDDNGAVLLMSQSGLTAGRVGERLFVSKHMSFQPKRAAGASSGELLPVAPLDATARIYSESETAGFGLTAVVGVETAVAMARFQRHRRQYIAVAGIASILIALIVAILMKQSAQLRSAMRAARSAQATLRAASEGSLDGLLILKAWPAGATPQDFIIEEINERGAAMIGHARAELLGQKAFALLPGLRLSGFFERYAQVYRERTPIEEEVDIGPGDDAPRWVHHQIVPLEDGVAVTSRDITARKLAEIETRTSRSFLQSLIDHLPLLVAVKSMREQRRGTMMVWNKAAEAATGYSAAHVVGSTDSDIFPPGFALYNPLEDQAMLALPMVQDLPEKLLLGSDGSQRYLRSVAVPLFDDQGKTEFILYIGEDITLRREHEQSLRAGEAHLAAVTSASPLGLVRTDMLGNCIYVNKRFATVTGLTREQSLGRGWLAAFEGDESAYMPAVFEHQRKHEEPFVRITRCHRSDGKLIWASTKIAAIRIDGRIEGFIGSIDDITVLRDAELALRESEARLRTIADTLPTMVAYLDAGQVYRFHNRAYDREFGREGIEVLGMTVRATIGAERYDKLEPFIARALGGETLSFEEHDGNAGFERTFEVTYIPQFGDGGGDGGGGGDDDSEAVVGFHVMRQDITSQKHEKKRLLKLAQVDPLTGLANRAGFLHKLGEAMRSCAGEGRLMALMYMDIDHFKPVNDTHGHQVGDCLLKGVSARLTQALRASDTIARMGGDEFTIIAEKLGRHEDAAILAGKIVTAMQAPFELDGVTVNVSASIGLAYFCDGPIDPDALIKQADRLLYQAKEAGRNTFRAA